jgi:hypothetical protein
MRIFLIAFITLLSLEVKCEDLNKWKWECLMKARSFNNYLPALTNRANAAICG